MILPKGLGEAAETAQIFSAENADRNNDLIDLKPGRLTIKGQGTSGWYSESKKIASYDGERLRFLIAPKLLIDLTNKHHECEINENILRINGGNFIYVTCLGSEDDFEDVEAVAAGDDETEL